MTLDEYISGHPEDGYEEPDQSPELQELLEEAYEQAESLESALDRLHDYRPRKVIREALKLVYEIQSILETEY